MKKIILASQSPRRQQLMREVGLEFEVVTKEGIEEIFPQGLNKEEIAEFLANLKAKAFKNEIDKNTVLITADTIVWRKGKVLGKPKNKEEAFQMLSDLSGKKHWVITGVCIQTLEKKKIFHSKTKVKFAHLSSDEINHYISHYQPFDKAGAYGIQEWIGHIAVERIEGSYFNVMGLPIQKLYQKLKKFDVISLK